MTNTVWEVWHQWRIISLKKRQQKTKKQKKDPLNIPKQFFVLKHASSENYERQVWSDDRASYYRNAVAIIEVIAFVFQKHIGLPFLSVLKTGNSGIGVVKRTYLSEMDENLDK